MKKIISLILALVLSASVAAVSASARVYGDVDGNGKSNSMDALQILKYSVGLTSEIDRRLADIDCNGTVNSADALAVLRASVGFYNGPTSIDNKADIIDPILKTGKFTLATKVDMDGTVTPATIMVSGNNFCTSMVVQGITTRLLILNGQAYMVFPALHVYAKIDSSEIGNLNFGDFSTSDGMTFAGSKFVQENGKTYICDSYKAKDGSQSDYYFLNGKWVKMVDISDGETTTQEITDFKAGVDNSYFSLSGMKEVELPN